MLRKNEIHTVRVTDLSNLGHGVGRIDGTVAFVRGALPSEVAEAQIIKVAKDYVVCRVVSLTTVSPDRIESDCAVSTRCGGCRYRNLSHEAELRFKRAYCEGAMRKVGLSQVEVLPVTPSPRSDAYRNKVLYPIDNEFRIGYYAEHSHNVIPCDTCRLESEALTPVVRDLQAFFAEKRPSNLRNLYLRIAEGTGQIMVCPVLTSSEAPFASDMVRMLKDKHSSVVSVYLNINPDPGNVVLGERFIHVAGDKQILDTLCSLTFAISPASFYQVNRGAAELLYEEAVSRAEKGLTGESCRVADLYCGTGTIGLVLASRLKHVALMGVEIVPEAVRNAQENAKRNHIENAVFHCGDAMQAELSGYDCVLLDPPRKGSSRELLEKLAREKVKTVVYISCNPDTLARDSAILKGLGYRMGTVAPFDLFPRTGSIECVTDFTLEENGNE